jgi:hypothetical protein
MDKPLWQMDIGELLRELEFQHLCYTVLKETYIKEIEKEILKRIKENEE